jgi:hypothetical protein
MSVSLVMASITLLGILCSTIAVGSGLVFLQKFKQEKKQILSKSQKF